MTPYGHTDCSCSIPVHRFGRAYDPQLRRAFGSNLIIRLSGSVEQQNLLSPVPLDTIHSAMREFIALLGRIAMGKVLFKTKNSGIGLPAGGLPSLPKS